MKLSFIAVAALLCLALAPEAWAQDVVTNGGFETNASELGVPTGWTTDAPAGIWVFLDNGSFATRYGAPSPHTGDWDVVLGPDTDNWLNQTLSTQAGHTYDVSFWLYNLEGGSGNDFSAYWGGTTPSADELGSQDNGQQLLNLSNAGTFGWTQYTDTVTATSDTTDLTFFGANASYFYGLDDVTVTDTSTSAVPEPSFYQMSGLILASGVGLAIRRRLAGRLHNGHI